MGFFTVRKIWPALLFLPTGVGIALAFTLLQSIDTWLQILVAAVAMGTSFLSGLFSTGLGIALLLPVVVLTCLLVAFSIFGAPSTDVEPLGFAILLSLIYGGVAYFAFGAGWIVRGLLIGFDEGNNRKIRAANILV